MSGVRLRHPDLPGQEITVASSAVPIHQRSGWEPAPGQPVTWEPLPPEVLPFGGQLLVRMRHPTLPGQEITIAASAVPHHRSKGWQVVEEGLEAETANQPAALSAGPTQEARPARHRGGARPDQKEER